MRDDTKPAGEASTMVEQVADVAARVARPAAARVDAEARFPADALAALGECGALGAAVPRELGGGGATLRELARACAALGEHCASSAMILAMHHIQVLSIARHGPHIRELSDYLASVAGQQRLIASVTSEAGIGGDLRRSSVALEHAEGGYTLHKAATTVSYGEHADDLLITARRSADAAPGDQVLVLSKRGQHRLKDVGRWDTLGMRGTCSPPATVVTRVEPWQVLPAAFGDIATHSMVPISHILWSACWLGIAQGAHLIARRAVRARAPAASGSLPPGAEALAASAAKLQLFSDTLDATVSELGRTEQGEGRAALGSFAFGMRINNLKLCASRFVVEIVGEALTLAGMAGYRNDSADTLGRHLRDAYSAPLMINNLRIGQTNAALALMRGKTTKGRRE